MGTPECEIGMVGLGVMGRNLLFNMIDHGTAVAGTDKDPGAVRAARLGGVRGAESIDEFVKHLRRPRSVMMLVPAGPPVDSVIRDLLPFLEPGDLVIDGGNSHFSDTDRRAKALAEQRIAFLGVGVSGGEEGARRGPSMMPGGPREAYDRVRPLFEAIAAHVDDIPCVTWLGPGSAGHYVKMVHNGIEYGLLQLIAETYDLLKRGLGLDNDEIHAVYEEWNRGELGGFLLEITARIFERVDERTGKRLIDAILDVARQKGTGMWTSQDAMTLNVPVPTIDAAVAMRNLSGLEAERKVAAAAFRRPVRGFLGDRTTFVSQVRGALHAATIITYAQGMALLGKASVERGYGIDREAVARIWRGGCIIRSAFLEKLRAAYRREPGLENPLLDPDIGREVETREGDLRSVAGAAADLGIPAAALTASLAYFDAYRSRWLPANLIQAQRDYFGAHTYERVDARGTFHTQWSEDR